MVETKRNLKVVITIICFYGHKGFKKWLSLKYAFIVLIKQNKK